MDILDPQRLPRHVAVIMDGNGRWARQRRRNRTFGHEKGAEAARGIIRACSDLGIPHLTLYAFSTENWQRPATEIRAIFTLLGRFIRNELPELISREVRVVHMGEEAGIPKGVLETLRNACERTRGFSRLTLALALNYGGRQEIARAARLFAEDVASGRKAPSDLTPEVLSGYLYHPLAPDPDLLIRTGGEHRISNFLLWEMAYAEIFVTETLWPEFTTERFLEALANFQHRERRFGKTGEQVRGESDA